MIVSQTSSSKRICDCAVLFRPTQLYDRFAIRGRYHFQTAFREGFGKGGVDSLLLDTILTKEDTTEKKGGRDPYSSFAMPQIYGFLLTQQCP